MKKFLILFLFLVAVAAQLESKREDLPTGTSAPLSGTVSSPRASSASLVVSSPTEARANPSRVHPAVEARVASTLSYSDSGDPGKYQRAITQFAEDKQRLLESINLNADQIAASEAAERKYGEAMASALNAGAAADTVAKIQKEKEQALIQIMGSQDYAAYEDASAQAQRELQASAEIPESYSP